MADKTEKPAEDSKAEPKAQALPDVPDVSNFKPVDLPVQQNNKRNVKTGHTALIMKLLLVVVVLAIIGVLVIWLRHDPPL